MYIDTQDRNLGKFGYIADAEKAVKFFYAARYDRVGAPAAGGSMTERPEAQPKDVSADHRA